MPAPAPEPNPAQAPDPSPAQAILAEHRALHDIVAGLERATDPALTPTARSWEPVVRATWLAGLAHRLADLRARLSVHFEIEEQAGLYDDLEEADPALGRAAQRLRLEHDRLRHGVERLQADAEGACADLPGLAGRVRDLLKDLEHHEARENEALTRSLADGFGAGD